MSDERQLIVGLGNPGPGYARTRHNAGFLVVDLLAARMGGRFKSHRSRCDVLEGRLAGTPVVLAKPRSFMNESGGPVNSVAAFYKVPLERLIVVHDDIDLPYGVLRLKRGAIFSCICITIEKLELARVRSEKRRTRTPLSIGYANVRYASRDSLGA